MFVVPSYTAPGQAWQLVDYKPGLVLTTTPAAAGSATVTGPQIPPGYMWSVQRAVCSCTSTAATQLRLYDDTVAPGNLLSGSNTGNYDEADYPAGLLLDQGRQLVAVWTGAAAGAVGTLRLQIAVLALAG